MKSSIYSIGHGNKKIDLFIKQLIKYRIDFVFDVRSVPMSNHNPLYNQPLIERELLENRIGYEFLGEYLGGRPDDSTCYTNGKVDYSKIREKDFFKEGIKLLINVHNENIRIAIMCSESKPEECHRSKLIGQELLKYDIVINHIVSNKIIDQITVIQKLTKGKGSEELFGEKDFTSRKEYK